MAKKSPIGEESYRPLLNMRHLAEVVQTPIELPVETQKGSAAPDRASLAVVLPSSANNVVAMSTLANNPPAPFQVEKMDQEKRVLVTKTEAILLDGIVATLAADCGTTVKMSHVIRALLSLLVEARPNLSEVAKRAQKLPRPTNGDLEAISRFEKNITGIITEAIFLAKPKLVSNTKQ